MENVMTKLPQTDFDKIKCELARRFPQTRTYPCHFRGLLSAFASSGLADSNFVDEISSGVDGKFWARVWEAMLYRHLSELTFEFQKARVTKSGQPGPDFGIVHEGQTIWIEAVTPAPENIPQDYLEAPKRVEAIIRRKPHEPMLLRWTSVLKDKRDKLKSYVEKDIIAPTDCTVIAVNSCRLSDFAVNDLGISGWPFAVEAVFPLGPLAAPITPDGKPDGELESVPRPTIRKSNGKDIPTGNFLDPSYANVSAIMGCYRKDMVDGLLPLTVVHNPLATVRLPRGILGASKEYVTADEGDHYILKLLSQTSG
jgi:type I restriction enzyme S subunit